MPRAAAAWIAAIDAWTSYMIVAGLRPRTIELRRWQLGRVAVAHARRSPWQITSRDLITWLAARSWASETRKSYRSAIQSFYRWAAANGHLKNDPAAKLPTVRTQTPPPKPAPDDVLEHAVGHCTDRDRLIVLLAAYAGLRRAEIAALQWADVQGGLIRVVHGKGGRTRIVPLHPVLAGELAVEAARRRRGSPGSGYRYAGPDGSYVFPGRSGGPMTPGAAGKAASAALGPGWAAHALRHRFATRAYAGTRDLLAVQALLGHAKPETTKRYTDLADDSLLAAVRAV